MKGILFAVLLLLPLMAASQVNTIPQGTGQTLFINRGSQSIDSTLNIPLRDTVQWYSRWGNLTIRPQDNKLYFRSGGAWKAVVSNAPGSSGGITWADTLTGRPIPSRANLKDTSALLRGQIQARFKISNLVTSLLGYTANDTTVATTGALTEYIQTGVNPFLFYAYDRTIDSIDVYGTTTKYIKLYRQSLPALIDSFQDNNTTYTPGWGLLLTGTSFRVDTTKVPTFHDLDSVAGFASYTGITPISVNSVTHEISLLPSGVFPGVYTKVTVNDKGLVTAGAALDPGDIPNIPISTVNGLTDSLANHNTRISTNRQAIIDSTNALRAYTNGQLALKENLSNKITSLLGYTTTDTTYPTTGAIAEVLQATVYPFMYYSYDRAIDSLRITGDSVKVVTLYRRDGNTYVDSFIDNNTVFDSSGVYAALAGKVNYTDSNTVYATQYDNSLKQDIANITDDALSAPNSTEYPSTKAVSDAIDTALSSVAGAYVPLSSVGVANGVAPLDAGGKVDFSYLPASLMIYKGVWDPVTNTPTLINGAGTAGWVYKASWVGGADSAVINLGAGNITFYKGDFVLYNGSTWERSVGTDNVVSVNNKQGVVFLNIADLPGLADSLAAKEPVFSKGNLVAGSNVSLSGTLTNRLVGTGNVTINASVPAGYVQFSDTLTTIATKKNLKDTAAAIRGSLSAYELLANKVTNFNTPNHTQYPSAQAVSSNFVNGYNPSNGVRLINNAALFDLSPSGYFGNWHDVFAFGNRLLTWENTTDYGSSWSTGTANMRVFNQKQGGGGNTTLTNTAGSVNGIRLKWSGFNFGQLQWMLMQLDYTGPNCFFDVIIEESADNSTWTTISTYTNQQVPGATTSAWRFNQNTATYNRITILLDQALSPAGGTASVANIIGLALRAGQQGYGKEYMFPYTWTDEKYMSFTTPSYTPASGSSPLPSNMKVALLDSAATGKQLKSASLTQVLQGQGLATADSTIWQTKYRSDTARTNVYSSLAGKVNLVNGGSPLSITGTGYAIFGLPSTGVGLSTTSTSAPIYLKTGSIGFAKLKTDLLTGPDRLFFFPDKDGTLATTADIPNTFYNSDDTLTSGRVVIGNNNFLNFNNLGSFNVLARYISLETDDAEIVLNSASAFEASAQGGIYFSGWGNGIRMQSSSLNAYTANIKTDSLPADITLQAPGASGTLALRSDLPDLSGYMRLSNSGGQTMAGAGELLRFNDLDELLVDDANKITLSTDEDDIILEAAGSVVIQPSAGNVGIGTGTTAPAQKLEVNGTIRQAGALNGMLKSNASGDISLAAANIDFAPGIGGTGYIQNNTGAAQNAGFSINLDSRIYGSADTVYTLELGTSSSGYNNGGRVQFRGAAGAEVSSIVGTFGNGVWNGANAGRITFNTYQSGAVVPGMTLNGNNLSVSGKVGIGTSTPAQALHVVGTIRQTNVTGALLRADGSGDIRAAIPGEDYVDTSYLAAGPYTPTITGTADSFIAKGFTYTKTGNIVTVTGRIQAIALSALTNSFFVTLPIPSSFTGENDCIGNVSGIGGTGDMYILADTGGNAAEVVFTSSNINAEAFVHFQYVIQ